MVPSTQPPQQIQQMMEKVNPQQFGQMFLKIQKQRESSLTLPCRIHLEAIEWDKTFFFIPCYSEEHLIAEIHLMGTGMFINPETSSSF